MVPTMYMFLLTSFVSLIIGKSYLHKWVDWVGPVLRTKRIVPRTGPEVEITFFFSCKGSYFHIHLKKRNSKAFHALNKKKKKNLRDTSRWVTTSTTSPPLTLISLRLCGSARGAQMLWSAPSILCFFFFISWQNSLFGLQSQIQPIRAWQLGRVTGYTTVPSYTGGTADLLCEMPSLQR